MADCGATWETDHDGYPWETEGQHVCFLAEEHVEDGYPHLCRQHLACWPSPWARPRTAAART